MICFDFCFRDGRGRKETQLHKYFRRKKGTPFFGLKQRKHIKNQLEGFQYN
jgi:hypothetical protein